MQQGIGLKAPTTRAELDALMARRAEMQAQLKAADTRRFELTMQRQSVEGQPLERQLDRTINALDGRVDQLEKQIAQANDLIAAALAQPKIAEGGPWSLLPGPGPGGADIAQTTPPPSTVAVVPSGPEDVPQLVGRALAMEGIGFLLFGAIAWFWAVRRLERRLGGRAGGDPATVMRLQQSIDAIALEVERISENQRYVTKVLNDKALGAGQAQPIEAVGQREPARRP